MGSVTFVYPCNIKPLMMMIHLMIRPVVIYGFAILLTAFHSYAQDPVVIDRLTKEIIPFSTLINTSTNSGFVADKLGRFEFSELDEKDSFELRCIGYDAERLTGKQVVNSDTLWLIPSSLELQEVVIRPISAHEFLQEAVKAIPDNYRADSFYSQHYYQEWLKEDHEFLRNTQAFLEANLPGYSLDKDSFDLGIRAGKCADEADLNFMQKEIESSRKKELRRAERKGEELDEEEQEMNLEIGNPYLMLIVDPIRHPERSMQVQGQNAAFLENEAIETYDFWYGKPISYGDQQLVVIHFDQKDDVKEMLFKGTVWIEPISRAIAKIEFGFSDKAVKKLVPTHLRALMWVIGLNYDLKSTLFQFEYRLFQDKWIHASSRLKADIALEKRRMFSEDEYSYFEFECEMLSSRYLDKTQEINTTLFDRKERLSIQVEKLTDNRWAEMEKDSRKFQ